MAFIRDSPIKDDKNLTCTISKNTPETDQTPTPTRFIRNCEEIGLFQDLQNVNPFDETFKKAMELSPSGKNTTTTSLNNEDEETLHTPNILLFNVNEKLVNNARQSSNNKGKLTPTKNQEKILKQCEKPVISNSEKKEMNRAAQSRCRTKKKIQMNQMLNDLQSLKENNRKLLKENRIYKYKLDAIQKLIDSKQKSLEPNTELVSIKQLEDILKLDLSIKVLKNEFKPMPKLIAKPILPTSGKTVMIQLLGGQVEELAVTVLPQ